jgi:lysophospholipase L1-like esterase
MIQALRARMAPGSKARILAYGSSNTERFQPGMHWVDVLELALRDTYGRFHRCVNTGQCGDTSRGLLERFAEEAAGYRPHLAIITIGGNDANPAQALPAARFEANLLELHERFGALGCGCVFQTYYAPDPARNGDLGPFRHYMEIVRTVARRTDSPLVDHLPRWEAFQRADNDRYLQIMLDGFHVNPLGNLVLGLDVASAFGARPAVDPSGFWDEALAIQKRMDELT